MTSTPSPACLELATFRARPGLTTDEVGRALAASHRWLAAQPGFRARRLFLDAEGTWVDEVEWRSAEDAHAAMAAYPASPAAPLLDRIVDPASFRCLHAAPVPLDAGA